MDVSGYIVQNYEGKTDQGSTVRGVYLKKSTEKYPTCLEAVYFPKADNSYAFLGAYFHHQGIKDSYGVQNDMISGETKEFIVEEYTDSLKRDSRRLRAENGALILDINDRPVDNPRKVNQLWVQVEKLTQFSSLYLSEGPNGMSLSGIHGSYL
ncbi:MAG: hypothetical protein CMO81_04560 [Waddliaceae bacterium]|nr:hypothetical protein [Waddliaceae bacterium]